MHTLRPGPWLSGLLLLQTALLPATLALGGPALAQPADPTANPAAGLVLPPAAYRAVLGQPPAPGSRLELDDLAILRWNQRSRTPAGILHSWRFLNRRLSLFDAAVGADLARTAPLLYAGLPAFLGRADGIKDVLKDAVARPRPFLSHPDLKPCLPLESSWSFPSGHATWFATAALLLADLLPERRERLLPVGLQGGYVRAYCAMHYPSDVLAGQRLAEAISRDVIVSPQWRRFRQQVAGERRRLLAVPPAGLPLLAD
ncbi:membrane-associated phospholipid phosphatase [Cyanobium sp. Copco_Reservoir_LC18]|uniref:phosphatase PAP2 family protein n=1 Tax=Cyanobium sp. Copco_Reservoir_LC18 TaxID=1328305 RepID=UPI001359E575|nr:phosphatase PAP2 family protein [Cyanobium sp. Copco_Reservoir_LC18]KAF0653325.1 membrane-associated phospholipid phosphatase [Cyanobium sp. Copco_Reservoir_LC18]